ncbi:MAG: glycosyl hydrolase, partial [Polaribacter sp.]|nr:glycosyl hydrolase [Polaribacter sp.]
PLQLLTDDLAEKSAHFFAINSIRKSKNWGSSRGNWSPPNIPEINISFYSNETKKVIVDVFSNDIKVNSISVDADKGFNEVLYDVSFSKKGKEAYNKANKEAVLEQAKNDIYYLPKGKYTVKIGKSTSEFEVK